MPVALEDGALRNLLRLPRVAFDVFRYWLPNLLPWPYWILLAFGVRRLHRSGPDGRRLNQLFVATIVPVLAFVAVTEPHLYGALGWPIRSDYWTQPVVEGALLADRSAADFTTVLRAHGYRYLMFALPPGSTDRVPEEGWRLLLPRRSMLSEMAAEPARFGLRPLAAPAPLQAFEIRP